MMEFNDPFTPNKHSNTIISHNGGMPLIYGSNVSMESPDVTSKFHIASSKSVQYNNHMVKKNISNNSWGNNNNDSSNSFISPKKNKNIKSYSDCSSPISSNYNSNSTPSTPISSTPKNITSTPETPITPYMMSSQIIGDENDDNQMESWENRSSPLRSNIISPTKEQWNCAKPQSFNDSPSFNDFNNDSDNDNQYQKNNVMNSSITNGDKNKTSNINNIKTEKNNKSSMPLVYGSNVTMASPDVSSKFYEGTKYVAIPANINNNINNRSFKNSKSKLSFNNSQSLVDNSISNDKLERLKSKSSFNNVKEVFNNNLISNQHCMPLIGGSNVTMESPDVTSKFYEGHRDYNTQTTPIVMQHFPNHSNNNNIETPTSDYNEGQSFSAFSPMMSPANEEHLETWHQLQSFSPCPFNSNSNEKSAKKVMPLIFGSNVSVNSPDVSSKFHDNKLIHDKNSLKNVPNFNISDENCHPIINTTSSQKKYDNKAIRTGGFNDLTSKNAINDARNMCNNIIDVNDENASKSFNLNKLLTNIKEKTNPRIVLSDISNLQKVDQLKELMNDKDVLVGNQIQIPSNYNNKVNILIHQISPTSISDSIYSPDSFYPNHPDYKLNIDKGNKKELKSLSAWSPSHVKENKINNLSHLSSKEYNRADLSSQFQIELDSKIDDVIIPLIPLIPQKPSKPLERNDSRSKLERNPLSNSRKFIQPIDNENKENNTANENNMGNIIIHIPAVPSAPIGTPRAPSSNIPSNVNNSGGGNSTTFKRSPKNYISPIDANKMIVHSSNIDILDIIEKVQKNHEPSPPLSKLTINDEISIENKIIATNSDVNIEEIIDFAQKKIENVIPENNSVNVMKFDNFQEEVVISSNNDDFEICNNNEDFFEITSDNMNMNRNISSPPIKIRELIGFKSPLKSPPKFVQELIVYPEDLINVYSEDLNKPNDNDLLSPQENDVKINNNQSNKKTKPMRRRYKRRVFDPSLLESIPEEIEIEFDIPNWLQLHYISPTIRSKKVLKSKPKKDNVDSNYTIWLRDQISISNFSNSMTLQKYPWLPNLYQCINETNLTGLKDVENIWLTYLNDLSSVELIDDNHNTPLMIASWIGCRRVVKYLLRRGCDINAQNINGNTSLHFASECHHSPVVEYLLKKGANDALKNSMNMNHFGR